MKFKLLLCLMMSFSLHGMKHVVPPTPMTSPALSAHVAPVIPEDLVCYEKIEDCDACLRKENKIEILKAENLILRSMLVNQMVIDEQSLSNYVNMVSKHRNGKKGD